LTVPWKIMLRKRRNFLYYPYAASAANNFAGFPLLPFRFASWASWGLLTLLAPRDCLLLFAITGDMGEEKMG
jgi:hypothetical protein